MILCTKSNRVIFYVQVQSSVAVGTPDYISPEILRVRNEASKTSISKYVFIVKRKWYLK